MGNVVCVGPSEVSRLPTTTSAWRTRPMKKDRLQRGWSLPLNLVSTLLYQVSRTASLGVGYRTFSR